MECLRPGFIFLYNQPVLLALRLENQNCNLEIVVLTPRQVIALVDIQEMVSVRWVLIHLCIFGSEGLLHFGINVLF